MRQTNSIKMKSLMLLLVLAVGILAGCGEEQPVVAVGTLERERIELRAERQEPIVRLAVREGDRVSVGAVVAELDPRRAAAQLAQAVGARDQSAARLAELVRGTRRESIEQSRAELAEAEAALIRQRPEVVRIRNLVADGIETQSALDAVEATAAAAEARLTASRSTLERLLNGSTVEELDQARAGLARDDAQVAKLEIDLQRLTVVAPRAGTVDALPFKVGDEPQPGGVVAVILAEGAPFARVYIPAELRPGVVPGQRASVRVDGFAAAFEGRVRTVSGEAAFTPYFALTEADRGNFTYLAEIDLVDESARELPTGLPVEVAF